MYDIDGFGIEIKAGNRVYAYNNTFARCTVAMTVELGTTGTLRNNLATACGPCLETVGTVTGSGNLTGDATAAQPGLGSMLPSNDVLAYFASANDFHLAAAATSASAVRDVGANLSTDPDLSFTTDIDGLARSGAWDVGADELGP